MSRRYDLFLFALLILGPAEPASLERVQILMGTAARIRVWGDSISTCERAVDAAFREMAEVDRLMSTYRPESEISRLNRTGASGWVEIDPRFYEVLRAARTCGDLSGGAFDHTVLPLMRLWGFRGRVPAGVPPPGVLREHLERVGYWHVRLHPGGRRVRFDRPGVEIDLGGIAKGYAIDRAVARLKTEGATGGVVDLGGNLFAFGTGPEADVGVQHPRTPDGLLGTFPLQDASAATSGGYERYVTIRGRRYGHILDPRTGRPAEAMLSATAVAPTGTAADALSTALFVLGPREGAALLERLDGVEGILVWEGEGGRLRVYVSAGLRPRFAPADTGGVEIVVTGGGVFRK